MSLGNVFSSAGKQAGQAANASTNATNPQIANLEKYENTQLGNLRGGIAAVGPNPYFAASQQINPSSYAVNPSDTVNFSTPAAPNTITMGAPSGSPNTIPAGTFNQPPPSNGLVQRTPGKLVN
jgi:hypothetical protein